jgi:ADP-heptose:LPS heptosyltransferase
VGAAGRSATVRIVALRALGLGDLLTAVPALRALLDAHPHATLQVAAPRALAPLIGLAGGEPVEAAPLQPLPGAAHDADLLVNLHGRGPESHAVALAAHPRRLVAFAHPAIPETRGPAPMPDWRAGEHEVERWCRLLSECGIPADPSRLDLPAPPLPRRLSRARGATVVHPGAASGARRWPAERFAAIAAEEVAAGRAVVLTGGVTERPLALRVARAAGLAPSAVLAGHTDLAALAAVVAHAGRVVCGDTGVAHLATAFGVPSVVLFGPTSPAHWGPPPGRARHRVLWAGRTGDPHADAPHDGLLEIAPRDVLAELAGLPT